MKKGLLLLADGFEEIEALTVVDLLRRASIEITTTGISGTEITGSHNIKVHADTQLSSISAKDVFDFIVLPGGMPGAKNIADSAYAVETILRIYKKGGLVAAICAAPAVVLYPLGILNNKTATCYPGYESTWQHAVFSKNRVVVDDNVITSRGPGTATEFSLAIIEYLVNLKTAEELSKKILL